jgi:hypothetical protein
MIEMQWNLLSDRLITPWRWSEEAFDLVGVKTRDELQKQAVVQPPAGLPVADLHTLYTLRYDIADR